MAAGRKDCNFLDDSGHCDLIVRNFTASLKDWEVVWSSTLTDLIGDEDKALINREDYLEDKIKELIKIIQSQYSEGNDKPYHAFMTTLNRIRPGLAHAKDLDDQYFCKYLVRELDFNNVSGIMNHEPLFLTSDQIGLVNNKNTGEEKVRQLIQFIQDLEPDSKRCEAWTLFMGAVGSTQPGLLVEKELLSHPMYPKKEVPALQK